MANKARKIAESIFGKSKIKSIRPYGSSYTERYKIVVFVPLKNADELAFAMASAGAGIIGNYSVCTFRIKGVGTFIGNKKSNPKAGDRNKYEMVEEIRLEMICDKKLLDKAVDKIFEVHPYEEPAFEIYKVMTKTKSPGTDVIEVRLKNKFPVKKVLNKINRNIKTDNLPAKIKNIKTDIVVIDSSVNAPSSTSAMQKSSKNKTLYIKNNKNITNIELI